MAQDHALLDITGTVERVTVGRQGKSSWLRVRVRGVKADSYLELTAFRVLAGFSKGDYVRVEGHVSTKKLDGVMEKDAKGREYQKWVPDLILDSIVVVEEGRPSLPGVGAANDNRATPRGSDDDIPF